MAPFVPPAQQIATHKHDLWSGTLQKQKGDGGSSNEVEAQDTSPKSSDHSNTPPSYSNPKAVPMLAAKAVPKLVRTAYPTHKTGPKSTPKSASHPRSSSHAAHQRPSRTSTHEVPSNTPLPESPRAIPTSLSRPYSSLIPQPFKGHPRTEPSLIISPPPPQTHSISSHTRTIAAIAGSVSAVGLLVGLFFLLRCYCRRGGSNKRFNRTFKQKRKDEEAHPGKKPTAVRLSTTEMNIEMVNIEMVRPSQAPRRDFGSQFSPSLASQLQREIDDQLADENSDQVLRIGEVPRQHPLVLERAISYFSLPSPIVEVAEDEREISFFSLPSPVVGVAERAATFSGAEARIVWSAEDYEEDGGDVGRVVSLGDSCVIEMLVRVMDEDEERGEGRIVAQERREIDGVVVTVSNLGTRVVEAEGSGGERRAEEEGSLHGDLGIRVEDGHPHGRELDSEDEGDDCSFKSTRGPIGLDDPEGGNSSEEQTEGAGRDVPAVGRVEVGAPEGIRVIMSSNLSR